MTESISADSPDPAAVRWHRWIVAWLVLMAFAVAAFFLVVFLHPAYTASIEGLSEAIELQAFSREQHWVLSGFGIEPCREKKDGRVDPPRALDQEIVVVRPPARVRFEKLEDGQTFRIDVSSLTPQDRQAGCKAESPVALVRADGSREPIPGSHVLITRKYAAGSDQTWFEAATVLPVQGTVILGEEIGEGVSTMLLSGTVTMHADQSERFFSGLIRLFRKNTYVGETVALSRGDRILPTEAQQRQLEGGGAHSDQDPGANGYVRVTAKGPLQFGLIEPTRSVSIQRAGIATVEVDMSFWQRVQNEPALTALIAMMVALIAVVELREAFSKPYEHWRKPRNGAR